MVDAVRRTGLSDAQLAEYGRAFVDAGPEARARVFPDAVAGLTPETGYGWDELRRDLPALVADFTAQLAVRAVDVSASGASADASVPAPGAWGFTILHAEVAVAAAAAPETAPGG
ncbi:hypothetical protein [Nonomuraea longicatena]|uniref:Uncharacterized protein n=1 Tax=Nonomuraea longicatena TaxID=83682 RepID=A0ABP3ZC47_9ACTN